MKVIEIHKDQHMEMAGKAWPDVLGQATLGIHKAKVVDIVEGSADKDRPNRVLTGVKAQLPHLAVDHVWLREVDGRAFLYLCNY